MRKMSFFTEEQIAEITQNSQNRQEIELLLNALTLELNNKGITVQNENAKAVLNGMLSYLTAKKMECVRITEKYNSILDEYNAERDRICRDFDDDFIVKPETQEALNQLEEKFKTRMREMGEKKSPTRMSQI